MLLRVTTIVLCLFVLGGCATHLPVVDNPLEVATSEYPRFYRAAREVLTEQGYVLDQMNYRYGIVSTQPQYSATLFEPWRATNSTGAQSLSSTINHQRRVVTITLEPDPDEGTRPRPAPSDGGASLPEEPAGYLFRIVAMIEQAQRPVMHLTGSTSGHRTQRALREVPVEWTRRGIDANYWQPIERDPHLERRLMIAIINRSLDIRRAERDARATGAVVEAPATGAQGPAHAIPEDSTDRIIDTTTTPTP